MATFPERRRNTPAANADILGEDATYDAVPGAGAEQPAAKDREGGRKAAGRRREEDGNRAVTVVDVRQALCAQQPHHQRRGQSAQQAYRARSSRQRSSHHSGPADPAVPRHASTQVDPVAADHPPQAGHLLRLQE